MVCPSYQGGEKIWLIIDDCKRCNKIHDCADGFDELGCPAYLSPSFELPVICCPAFLILLHLGWKAVTRATVDEAREMEIIGAIGCQLVVTHWSDDEMATSHRYGHTHLACQAHFSQA